MTTSVLTTVDGVTRNSGDRHTERIQRTEVKRVKVGNTSLLQCGRDSSVMVTLYFLKTSVERN